MKRSIENLKRNNFITDNLSLIDSLEEELACLRILETCISDHFGIMLAFQIGQKKV